LVDRYGQSRAAKCRSFVGQQMSTGAAAFRFIQRRGSKNDRVGHVTLVRADSIGSSHSCQRLRHPSDREFHERLQGFSPLTRASTSAIALDGAAYAMPRACSSVGWALKRA